MIDGRLNKRLIKVKNLSYMKHVKRLPIQAFVN